MSAAPTSSCLGTTRGRATIRYTPIPATSRPMSSLTSSSAASAISAVRSRPAWRRSRATAVSTGANATSWKLKFSADAIGQLSR